MVDFLHNHWIEIFAVVTGLLYVYLQIRQNKTMWIVGFISSAMFVYVFFTSQIYAQSAIYVYYVVISVYGYFRWSGMAKDKRQKTKGASPIAEQSDNGEAYPSPFALRPLPLICLVVICLILSANVGWVLTKTDSPIPYFDGLIAGFSIVATWMVTQKIIQHWYFWIGINLFCVPLYLSQGLYFTAFMFLVYFIMSIIGLKEWKKTVIKQP
ncbi:MAG: nicotinamide riboside transporter PnuC [Bacteroidales bacterium]|nr:nicotinamide riboside transporter PnuC [Bacteroidales bacterium]